MSLDKVKVISKTYINDSRGWFLKMLTGDEHQINIKGEIYVTSAKPGETKGGHFHEIAKEWFCLIKGKAKLHLEDINNKNYTCILLDSNKPETIYVPPNIAHEFENIGKQDFILIAYTNIQYQASDTQPYKVLNG